MALCQAFMGISFGPEVDTAWEAAETASTLYADRHSSTAGKGAERTNGKVELGVKNSLSPVFGQQTRPAPDMAFETLIPFWLKDPAPRRGRTPAFGL